MFQLMGTCLGIVIAFAGEYAVYWIGKQVTGIHLSEEDEFQGADQSVHKISTVPEQ